jgi:hypothetical protein
MGSGKNYSQILWIILCVTGERAARFVLSLDGVNVAPLRRPQKIRRQSSIYAPAFTQFSAHRQE